MNRRALLIAYHFPPAVGSSGVHRAYSLARYLPEDGWEPIVLTVTPSAHPAVGGNQLAMLSPDIRIYRSLALDTARHLSVRGKYPGILAWPDRWVTWLPSAIARAVYLVKKYRPKIIWSTYPIVTAQIVGLVTAKITGLPWIADFRDSMTDDSYPPAGTRRRIIEGVERNVVQKADRVVFTAPGSQRMYEERYPYLPPNRWYLILNGYDEESFEHAAVRTQDNASGKVTILHSGVIYPDERDPSALFRAVSLLQSRGDIAPENLEIRLRATSHDELFAPQIESLGIGEIVKLLPPTSYHEALSEMMSVDGLLLLQASSCNHQIPAKAFEYIRAKKPIIALTDELGDTAQLLKDIKGTTVGRLDREDDIAKALLPFLQTCRQPVDAPDESRIASFSRRAQVHRTAALFDTVLQERMAGNG